MMKFPLINRKKANEAITEWQDKVNEQLLNIGRLEQIIKTLELDCAKKEQELINERESFCSQMEKDMAQLQVNKEAIAKEAELIISAATVNAQRIINEANDKLDCAKKEAQSIKTEAEEKSRLIIDDINRLKIKNEQYCLEVADKAIIQAREMEVDAKNLYEQWTTRASNTLEKAHADREEMMNGLSNYDLFQLFEKYDLSADKIEQCITQKEEVYFKNTLSVCDLLRKEMRDIGKAICIQSMRYMPGVHMTELKPIEDICLAYFDLLVDRIIEKSNTYGLEPSVSKIFALKKRIENAFGHFNLLISYDYIDKITKCLRARYTYEEYKIKRKEEIAHQRNMAREEEKAQREYERAIKMAEKDEERARRLIEEAQTKLDNESNDEKRYAELQSQIEKLNEALSDAIHRSERAKSMAEQTRRGYVYVISNIGSFGEGVFKIGLTRRLDPTERIDELSNASVPFPFDIHAIIESDDAPALESALHRSFEAYKLNKTNWRKEFFSVQLEMIEQVVKGSGIETKFIKEFPARQYRESVFSGKLKQAIIHGEIDNKCIAI